MQKYFEELLNKAYKSLKMSSLAVVVMTTILLFALYGYVNTPLLLVWYILIITVSFLRFYSSNLYINNPNKFTTQRWKQLFYLGLLCSSGLFGLTPFLFFVQDNYPHQAILIVMVAGMSAGGISSLSSLLRAVQLFLSILLLPLIIVLLLQDTFIHNTMALVILLYYVVMLYIAKFFHANYIDILTTKRMYEDEKNKLSLSEERFKAIFKQAPLGVLLYDTDLIIREVNQEFIEFLEVPVDYLPGLDLRSLPDQRVFPALSSIIDDIEGFYEGEYTTKYKQKNLWISMHTSPLKDIDGNVTGGIGIVSDITQRMLTQLQFEHQAKYDTLTNIPNRSYLLEKISLETVRYKRVGTLFGVLFLDLDHFKNINDSLGHALGDALLVQTTQRLKQVIREGDMLSRLGGDEFVILVTDLSSHENIAATKMELIAQKIHATLKEPFLLDEHTINVSSSIGITLISDANEDKNDMLKHADIAMYEAKKSRSKY